MNQSVFISSGKDCVSFASCYLKGHKNDFRDAHAVAEAVQRPTTRFVLVALHGDFDRLSLGSE
jgi:transposase